MSQALVHHLITRSAGRATYLGNGLFGLRASNGAQLVAGTGQWGSGEYGDLKIEHTGSSSSGSGSNGGVDVEALGLAVDLYKYWKKDEIQAEIEACLSYGNAAECRECVDDGLLGTLDTVDEIADWLDLVGAILACIFWPPAQPPA